jgi:hypothetical protein
MQFLHTSLLYLLPLAAIPIVLHLLTLHRLRTVELSTFRFLFDSYVQQRRRMKFLEALLAFLRTLFLLLLVLLCGRPVVKHWSALFGSGSGREVVMLVDCSASMNAQTTGLSSLERAKAAARSIVERLDGGDRLTLVRVAARPEEVFNRFAADTESVPEHIDELTTSPARANWLAALSQVFGKTDQARAQPTVYLFTDCQASGWKELATQGVERLVPADAHLVVVNVGSTQPIANHAVIGTPPRAHRGVVGLPVMLRPRVANYSQSDRADLTLSVFVDEKEVARAPLTIKPGEQADKEIVYVPTEPGTLRGRFQITGDRFPDDDEYLFTLSVAPPIKVLLVNGNPSADPFDNECLYLRTALTSRGEEDEGPPVVPDAVPSTVPPSTAAAPPPPRQLAPSKEYVRSLDVQEIPEGNLNPDSLRDAAVVVLANCGQLNQQHFQWLRDYVTKGGGLLIFPGDRVNPDVYNQQFFPEPGPLKEQLVPVRLGPPVGDPQKYDTFAQLTSLDYAHQVLNVFDDPESRYLTTASFYRRFPLVAGQQQDGQQPSDEPHAGIRPLAKFSSREPALIESRFRDGVVLLAAFPLSAKWTNLPLKPEFVPLVLRMVNYVEHRADVEAPSVVPADGEAQIAVAADWEPVSAKVSDVERHTSDVDFARSGSRWLGGFEKTALRGYYSIDVRGGQVEHPKHGATAFAVNLAPEESQFAAASEDDFHEWFPGVDLKLVDASAETQQQLGAVGDEREVWRYLLLIVFVVIGAEFMLATLGGKRRDVVGDDDSASEQIRSFNPNTWVGRMTGAGVLKDEG